MKEWLKDWIDLVTFTRKKWVEDGGLDELAFELLCGAVGAAVIIGVIALLAQLLK